MWFYHAIFALLGNICLLSVLLGITVYRIQPDWVTVQHQKSLTVDGSINKTLQDLRKENHEQELIDQQQQRTFYYGKSLKASAHFTFEEQSFLGKVVTLAWSQNHTTSLSNQGVKYLDGAIIVPHSGYYYVYSQILYSGDGTQELDYGRIIHNVLMQKATETKETPTILMQNLQSTPTIRRGRLAYTTSSLGATFFLGEGARVMVNSSIPQNIVKSPYSCYFGLHLI